MVEAIGCEPECLQFRRRLDLEIGDDQVGARTQIVAGDIVAGERGK